MYSIVTPFPFFLDFSFFVPLILRITLGIYVLAIAASVKKKEEDGEKKPLKASETIYRILFTIAGISMIIGFYTQISAIVIILMILLALLDKRASLTPEISRAEMSLLAIIAISLLLSGAGPLAIDLPL